MKKSSCYLTKNEKDRWKKSDCLKRNKKTAVVWGEIKHNRCLWTHKKAGVLPQEIKKKSLLQREIKKESLSGEYKTAVRQIK